MSSRGGSQLARLAPKGETQVLRELVHAVAEHHPDPDDPILAACHALCRSSPDLVGLQPDGRAVYYWPYAGFASAVPFDDEAVQGGEAERFAHGEGCLEAACRREYVWVHPDCRNLVSAEQ
jgi:hypothetical protein